MASLFASSRNSQCITSMRRATTLVSIKPFFLSVCPQVRGKKKLAKHALVKVRLLTDVARYGRQGSVISVAAGRMRNHFYPRSMAEYLTKDQLRELGIAEDSILEKDSTFGVHPKQRSTKSNEETNDALPVLAELDLPKPERALEILSMLIPPSIDFYRTPISTAISPPQGRSPSIPASSAISVAAASLTPGRRSIYGSVTTADIAANLKAVLAENDEGFRVIISPEDIIFVEDQEEKDRVKHIGVFEIVIRVKGATNDIRRTIKVNATD